MFVKNEWALPRRRAGEIATEGLPQKPMLHCINTVCQQGALTSQIPRSECSPIKELQAATKKIPSVALLLKN